MCSKNVHYLFITMKNYQESKHLLKADIIALPAITYYTNMKVNEVDINILISGIFKAFY